MKGWCSFATFLMAFKEHYILDIKYRDKAIEIIETLLPAIPYPKKKKKRD